MFSTPLLELLALTLCLIGVGGTLCSVAVWTRSRIAGGRCRSYIDQALATGLLAFLLLLLAGGSLNVPLLWLGAAVGILMLVTQAARIVNGGHPALTLILLSVGLLTLSATLALPLTEWDARSIWFHQAKVLYYFGPDWTYLRSLVFAHPDYPKLLPATGALVSHAIGSWSDTHAKFAGFLIAGPFLMAVTRLSLPASLSILAAWSWSIREIGSGYLDATLALGACVVCALIAEAEVLRRGKSERLGSDLVSPTQLRITAVLLAGLLLNLKNEGLFVLASVALALALILWRRRIPAGAAARWLVLGLAVASPYVWWTWIRRSESIKGDLLLPGPGAALERAILRLSDPDALLAIANALLLQNGLLLAGGVCIALALLFPIRSTVNLRLAASSAAAAMIYLGVLVLVYLITPNDLKWHLSTSASRVSMTPLYLTVLAAAYLLVPLAHREAKPDSSDTGALPFRNAQTDPTRDDASYA